MPLLLHLLLKSFAVETGGYNMNKVSVTRALAVITTGYALLVIVAGAAVTPGYSHVRQYISELGASGAAYGELVSWAGFLPVGILLALLLVVALPVARVHGSSRLGLLLFLGSQAIAYISAALAPCDLGCPAEGTATQDLHNLFGILTYMLAAVGLFLLSRAPSLSSAGRAGFMAAGLLWLAAFFLMLAPGLQPWSGLMQRAAETILWLAVLYIAFRMTGEKNR